MCVSEWGAGEVRQSRLMSEWWQLCDWCNGGRECVSAVHDGRCSPWVMCSLSEWQPDSWQRQCCSSACVDSEREWCCEVVWLLTCGRKDAIEAKTAFKACQRFFTLQSSPHFNGIPSEGTNLATLAKTGNSAYFNLQRQTHSTQATN